MYKKSTTIVNETGIHARPAGEFAKAAKQYDCKITVRNVTSDTEEVNAKSLVRIMSQEFVKGSVIEIAADGDDEEKAVEALIALVDSGFGE